VNLAPVEVDIRPGQTSQLRRSQAGEDRGQQQWPVPPFENTKDAPDFVRGGDVHPDHQLAPPVTLTALGR
jgi:hypothetical protein